MTSNKWVCFLSGVLACACGVSFAQDNLQPIAPKGSPRPPNADGQYQALRSTVPTGEGVLVKDFTLERDGGNFHFIQGSFYFYAPVNGRITGAVFLGTGHFDLAVESASEKHSLAMLSKGGVLAQDFTAVVLRFTDGTDDEIRKASAGSGGAAPSQAVSLATGLATSLRTKLHTNLEIRLLGDVLVPLHDSAADYFLASFRMGGLFTGRNVLFTVDPQETPDQVQLKTFDGDDEEIWAGYPMKSSSDQRGQVEAVKSERIDMTFENSGKLHATAETSLEILREGQRVVPLNLYGTLRVSGVFDEDGMPLDYVQEFKDYDPEFAIVLAKPAKRGSTVRVLTQYAGPDAVRHDGDGMYYLIEEARDSWYPGSHNSLGDFTNFHMTFHLLKGLQIVATGKEVSHEKEGDGTRVVWDSGEAIPVAGFNLGTFATAKAKTPQGFDVLAYANTETPDEVKALLLQLARHHIEAPLGNMTTVTALPSEVAQGSAAIQVYTDYFGKLPFDHVALTEQSACNFGQSWPMLVYLPICGFWDTTIQDQLGLLGRNRTYWQHVTAHEVAHQWWGQLVGFDNYRDQWMSEGFADFSVSLYLMKTSAKMDDYHEFWEEQKKNLIEKNSHGYRPIDVGPLTMGYRVNNEKTGNVYQDLIYSKGSYVMHMLQMLYWTPEQGDTPFKRSMQAFVKQYAGKSPSTEDLKASFERTMPKWVDAKGDGKLDWFFDEYIYGTELPHYDIASDFTVADGETSVHFKLSQSKVSPNFLMVVPLYLQMANGNTVRIATLRMAGEQTIDHTFKLGKLPSAGKKLVLNYNADVLSD